MFKSSSFDGVCDGQEVLNQNHPAHLYVLMCIAATCDCGEVQCGDFCRGGGHVMQKSLCGTVRSDDNHVSIRPSAENFASRYLSLEVYLWVLP